MSEPETIIETSSSFAEKVQALIEEHGLEGYELESIDLIKKTEGSPAAFLRVGCKLVCKVSGFPPRVKCKVVCG